MAFHQRIIDEVALCMPYEDTDEQRQAVWDSEMLLKDLKPLYRKFSLKVRRYRQQRSVYLYDTMKRRQVVRLKMEQAEDIIAWSLGG
jgi:hypothetical protein